MRKLFKVRKLFKGGNYMRKYGNYILKNKDVVGTYDTGPGLFNSGLNFTNWNN